MGFDDNFPNMKAAMQAAFGSVITYTPADGVIPPFATTGIFQDFSVDQMETHILRDTMQCTVAHSSLVAGGLTAPTEQTSSQAGDTITRKNVNSVDEVWTVIQSEADAEMGTWDLTLERAVRIVP